MKTSIGRALRMMGFVAGVLAWSGGGIVLLGWSVGQVFTDRWHWTQYCFWIPTMLAIPAAGVGMLAGWGLCSASRTGAAGRARVQRTIVVASFLSIVVAGVYAAVWEWRLLSPNPPTATNPFRVLHWNATSDIGQAWVGRIAEESPDLIVINPASYQLCREIVSADKPYVEPLYRHGFTVISRYRVIRTAYTTLRITQGTGIDPREGDLMGNHKDPGRAMVVELDTREALGRTLTVLCLDLPSDVSLHRAVSLSEAAAALAAYAGPFSVVGPDGIWAVETPPTPGFARPDLVLGDFNTPRGSASLNHLTSGLSAVFADAGRGPFGTWPYARPLWHLDQMFIAPWLRGVRYEPIDLGGGTHRAQVADLAPRAPG